MIHSPTSPDEARRLSVLRQYAVLDTLPDKALDDLTALAAQICETPMAVISLMDAHRQWFKARVGLELEETPRDISFCDHVLQQKGILVVEDATKDPRFSVNPLVTGEPGIRFYAGFALTTAEGENLGTLSVSDVVPRGLTEKQQHALTILAQQVMTHLELRRHTLALAASEERNRSIVDSALDAILNIDHENRITSFNLAAETIFGWKSDEVLGRELTDVIIPPRLREKRRRALEHYQKTGESVVLNRRVEITAIRADGSELPMELTATRLGSSTPPQFAAFLRDLTRHKLTEQTLAQRGEILQMIFDHIPVMICFIDQSNKIKLVNKRMEQVFGWTWEEIQAMPDFFAELYPDPVYRDEVLAFIHAATGQFAEFRSRTRSGSFIPTSFANVLLADGTSIGIGLDITERKQTESRFRRLVDSNAQGVVFWRDGRIIDANDAFLRMIGCTRDDLAGDGLDWSELTPPEYVPQDRHAMEEIRTRGVCSPFEKEYIRKDGTRVPVFVGAASFEDTPLEGVGFVLDLTERKTLEQQFLRAQRVESIGTLAGGIAHDLNNVLAPIIMSLDIMKLRFSDKESQDLLSTISSSAARGADMVRQVLSFARGVGGRRMEVQIKSLLLDVEKIANDTFLKHIRVRTIISADLWTVVGDPTQLHQLLVNLCVNARDAMPEGGVLTLSAGNLVLDAHYAALNRQAGAGPHVFVAVEDTGTGMLPDVLEKIFDPFFTTKDLGKGTGLGLSTSMAIVKSHKGFLQVHSDVGKGTKFTVYLPARTESSESTTTGQATEMPRGNGELILVVDDEPAVRQISQKTLEAFGYRVVLASDGAEAVAVYANQKDEIAVVLTDMMMPVMDGPATIKVIRKISPSANIIAASGLLANADEAAKLDVRHFLPKPYSAEDLLKALRELIGAAP